MSAVAAIVSRLIAAGTPPEVAAAAVAEAFAAGVLSADVRGQSVDESAERRREKDRIRQAERRAASKKSADNPQTSAESADCPNSTIYSSSPSSDSEDQEGKKERKSRGTKLSADWRPNETHYAAGAEKCFTADQVDGMAQDMRLWADANSNRSVARKANWDQTFHGWIRRQKPNAPPGQGPIARTVREQTAQNWNDALAKLDNFARSEPPAGSREVSANAVPLLPFQRADG